MTDIILSPRPQETQSLYALSLLGAGVPLSLLIDLATTVESQEIYIQEPGSADWLVAKAA